MQVNKLERDVLELLLMGDLDILEHLNKQLSCISVLERQISSAGFFTKFKVLKEDFFIPNLTFKFGDVCANMENLDFGAGFLLYVENGLIVMLEGYSYEEKWSSEIENFSLGYIDGKRNFNKLNLPTLQKQTIS